MNLHHKYTLCILTLLCHYCVIIAKAELNQRKLLEAKIANDVAEMERRKALAAAEANQQRKLAAKRESFGGSWEQVLRLGAEMAAGGDAEAVAENTADAGAEVVWRDTEARSFAAVVDGVTKLASAGVPIEQLLTIVPGMTQQQIQGIKEAMRGGQVNTLVDRLLAAPAPAADTVMPTPPIDQVLAEVDPNAAGRG